MLLNTSRLVAAEPSLLEGDLFLVGSSALEQVLYDDSVVPPFILIAQLFAPCHLCHY